MIARCVVICATILFSSICFAKSDLLQKVSSIKRCVDGDTLELMNGERVRILGIDAYDTKDSKMISKQIIRTDLSYDEVKNRGDKATKYCQQILTVSKSFWLKPDIRAANKDRYGRLLRYFYFSERENDFLQRDYGMELLQMKLGNVYCGDKKISMFDDYLEISEFKCK